MLVKIKRPITLYCSSGKHVSTSLNGISLDKIGISFSHPLKIGLNLGVKFTLPIHDKVYQIKAGIKVTHCHLQGNNHCSIARIISISPEHKAHLKRFVQNRTSHIIDAA